MKNPFTQKVDEKSFGKYYPNSTQKWLPIETVTGGLVLLKDGKECGRAVGYRDYKGVNDFIDM